MTNEVKVYTSSSTTPIKKPTRWSIEIYITGRDIPDKEVAYSESNPFRQVTDEFSELALDKDTTIMYNNSKLDKIKVTKLSS